MLSFLGYMLYGATVSDLSSHSLFIKALEISAVLFFVGIAATQNTQNLFVHKVLLAATFMTVGELYDGFLIIHYQGQVSVGLRDLLLYTLSLSFILVSYGLCEIYFLESRSMYKSQMAINKLSCLLFEDSQESDSDGRPGYAVLEIR